MSDNEVIINRSIEDMIEKVISKDIPHTSSLSLDVVSKIKPLLYLLISTDKLSVNNVSSILGINRPYPQFIARYLNKVKYNLAFATLWFNLQANSSAIKISFYDLYIQICVL